MAVSFQCMTKSTTIKKKLKKNKTDREELVNWKMSDRRRMFLFCFPHQRVCL